MDTLCKVKHCEFLINKNNFKAAIVILKTVIQDLLLETQTCNRDQELAEAYNNLGLIYYKKVEFKQALECYNKSLNFNSDFGVAFYNRGTVQYRLGFYEIALKDFEQANLHGMGNPEFSLALEDCRCAINLVSH